MVVDSLIAPSLFRWATNKRAAPLTRRGRHNPSTVHYARTSLLQRCHQYITSLDIIANIPVWAHNSAAAGLAIRGSFTLLVLDSINRADVTRMAVSSLEHASHLSPSPHRGQPFVLHSKHRNVMIAACAATTGSLWVVALRVSHQLKHASCNLDSNCTDPRALYALPAMTSTRRVSTFIINLAVGPCFEMSGRLSLDHHPLSGRPAGL